MAPEPGQRPPAPRVGRLLLHGPELRRHLALPVRPPARQFLPLPVEHDERGQGAGTRSVLDADDGRAGALEVRQGLGPVFRVGAGVADDVVRAVVDGHGRGGGWGGGGGGVEGGAEGDGGEAAVRFGRAGLPADDGEPVDGAVLVRVQAEAGERGQRRAARGRGRLERAEEGVFARVQPGGAGLGEAVAD